jgi:hypothetical protein
MIIVGYFDASICSKMAMTESAATAVLWAFDQDWIGLSELF